MSEHQSRKPVVTCPSCSWFKFGGRLESHFRWSPQCRPPDAGPSARDHEKSYHLFARRVQAAAGSDAWEAHTTHLIPVAHVEVSRVMLITIMKLVMAFILAEVRAEACTDEGVTLDKVVGLCLYIVSVFEMLPSAQTMINAQKKKYTECEPLMRGPKGEKQCCTFSIVQLLAILLTDSKRVRGEVIKSSEEWKSGVLYQQVPAVYADATHGSRFRESDACKLATEEQENDLRIGLHMWNDAFTSVGSLSTKAKYNKWEVVLCSLLNLPLYLRHYFDHILLLALAQTKWLSKNGGITRILCGVDEQGQAIETEEDSINLRSEVDASQERKVTITLPDDDNPGSEFGKEWTLVIYIHLISLDWLANGGFGPYAESVSANRPCFKCMWTEKCACAWIARTDPRNATIVHSQMCRRKEVRTHQGTLAVVQEMLALGAVASKLKGTQEGIFSTVFASKYLLKDIVKDSTIDIMHIFFASGVVPYTLSWLTDILIPFLFSWDQLNAAIKLYRSKHKNTYIPKLAKSGTTLRSSAKLALTASEGMAFTLASPSIFRSLLSESEYETPHMISWLKLVKLVRFVLRRQLNSATDPALVQELYDDWMRSIELVPQWTGYWKPKHHLGDHLEQSLKEWGPWRTFWCMWGEAFLQYLKGIFQMTNQKSAAYTVATLWVAKAKQRYSEPMRVSWHEDSVSALTDFVDIPNLLPPLSRPMMHGTCTRDRPMSARHLEAFTRARSTISRGDWVMVSTCGSTFVGCISEMIQVTAPVENHITLLVRFMLKPVTRPVFDEMEECFIYRSSDQCLLVSLEIAHVAYMIAEEHGPSQVKLRF